METEELMELLRESGELINFHSAPYLAPHLPELETLAFNLKKQNKEVIDHSRIKLTCFGSKLRHKSGLSICFLAKR